MAVSRRRISKFVVMAGLCAVLVIVALWIASRTPPPAQGESHPAVGQRLKTLHLAPLTFEGNAIELGDLDGKVTVIHFWATWCAPCWQELPHIAQLQTDFGDRKDFRLLSISSERGHEIATDLKRETQSVIKRFKVKLPAFEDPNSNTYLALPAPLAKTGFPKTVVLDQKGIVRGAWEDYQTGYELQQRRLIERLLAHFN